MRSSLDSLSEGRREMCTQLSMFPLSGIALSSDGAYSRDLLNVEHSMCKVDRCSVPHIISL